ncbi:MAG: substrate-binding domain-containing protein [Bacteroidetes bacterium]|nr:substrate-binding domain-containing protein [Bacteroidota bacterium]
MKKVVIVFFLILIVSMSVMANAEQDSGGKIKIGLAANNYNDKWMSYVRESMAKQIEKYPNYELVSVDAKEDVATQINQIENLINMGIEGLILLPVSADMKPAVIACEEAGIPVVTVSRRLDPQPDFVTHVGSDDVEAGMMESKNVFDLLGGKGKVAILQGPPSNACATDRTDGYYKTQVAGYPDIEFIALEVGNWNRDEGLEIVENWIQAGFEIDAILSNNDEMAIGAALAYEQADARGDIIIAGVDATADALDVMKKGNLDITVFQDCFTDGQTAVDMIIKAVEGEQVPPEILVPWQLVTPEKVDDFIKLWQ